MKAERFYYMAGGDGDAGYAANSKLQVCRRGYDLP
jgi:hypothetical protein